MVQKNVGMVSEGDIKFAQSSPNTLVIAFNVSIDKRAQDLATRNDIEIHSFDIIYKLTEWLDEYIKNQAPKTDVEEVTGRATLLKIFSKRKDKQVVGGKVNSGVMKVGATVNIMRRDNTIGTGVIVNLQQQKVDVEEVEEGNEFGTQIDSTIELAPQDTIESFIIVQK